MLSESPRHPAQPVSAIADTRTEEFARWDAWSGSPSLIAHVARTVRRAVSLCADEDQRVRQQPNARIVLCVEDDREVFASPEAFLESRTPEGLARFDQIAIDSSDGGLSAAVRFVRRPAATGGVSLTVSVDDPTRQDDVAHVAERIAVAVKRGYRRHLGDTAKSPRLSRGAVGHRPRLVRSLVEALPIVVGMAFGFLLIQTIDVLVPEAHLAPAVYIALMTMLGIAYPAALRYLVPNVEIVQEGGTRLSLLIIRTSQAFLALLLTHVVKQTLKIT